MVKIHDLKVFKGLVIVALDGFEGEPEYDGQVDEPGSANWLCERFGMADLDDDKDEISGILWTDYDLDGDWRFSVLIDAAEADDFEVAAEDAGYTAASIELVTEPTNFGDGGGTVEILKHRNGWVVLEA